MVAVLLSASHSPDIGQLLVWSPGGWDVLAQFLGYMPVPVRTLDSCWSGHLGGGMC